MRNHKGFTIMELMVVMAIVGIVTMVTMPNYISYRNKAKLNSAANVIKGDLHRAKIRAVKTSSSITVQFFSKKYTTSKSGISIGTNFFEPGVTYSADPTSPLPSDNVTFNAKGIPENSSTDTGRIILTGPGGKRMKRITIGRIGQITIETSDDGGANWS